MGWEWGLVAEWTRPRNVELPYELNELATTPDDYVFKNTLGAPIDQVSFYKLFHAAPERLGIRVRHPYATHTPRCPARLRAV
jgi:hypothetical protein